MMGRYDLPDPKCRHVRRGRVTAGDLRSPEPRGTDPFTVEELDELTAEPIPVTEGIAPKRRLPEDKEAAMNDEDFFKEDEPAAKVEAIWNRPGKKGRTGRIAAEEDK